MRLYGQVAGRKRIVTGHTSSAWRQAVYQQRMDIPEFNVRNGLALRLFVWEQAGIEIFGVEVDLVRRLP